MSIIKMKDRGKRALLNIILFSGAAFKKNIIEEARC